MRTVRSAFASLVILAGIAACGGSSNDATAPPTVSLNATPLSVAAGGSALLAWSSTQAESCVASGAWSGSRAPVGSESTGPLSASQSYALVCTGPGGTAEASVTVGVGAAPTPTVTLSVTPTSVAPGGAATLTWQSANATSCSASGAWSGPRSLSGSSSTGPLDTSRNYTLTCTSPGGTASQTVAVAVQGSVPPPAIFLSADPTSVSPGGSATLTWSTTNATTCTASGGWSGTRPVLGHETTGLLSATTRYDLECTGAGGSSAASVTVEVPPDPGTSVFPLRISANRRFLEDAAGRPFLLHGDTAWSLMVQLSREDVELYLNDRRSRGFNTLLMNLIEHKFADNPPRNWYGDAPFLTPGDFSTPNEAYFLHADWVLERARNLGFTVLLVPAYLGYNGGDEGWYQELLSNSDGALRSYGRFLGARYGAMDHIIWTHGGDFNPPQRRAVQLIADEIYASAPDRLATAHGAPETVAAEYWGTESWLVLNNVYTYGPVFEKVLAEYNRPGPIPFFFMEGVYENEQGSAPARIRTQAYHALLSGASGHVFGNNPIWNFGGAPLYPAPVGWKTALSGPGSRSMAVLWNLFSSIHWWNLVPDTENSLLESGLGTGQERAVAARSVDGGLALVYVPSIRDIRVNLASLAGPRVSASWLDPSNGSNATVPGSPFADLAPQTLRPPGLNANSEPDWVLVLESLE